MEFTILERFVLLSLTEDVTSTYTNYRIIHDFRRALSFSEEEVKEFKITDSPEGATCPNWDITTEIPVGDVIKGIVIKELETLDKNGLVHERYWGLFEKFNYGDLGEQGTETSV